jgi:adenine-specific DNA-methyltransferase
VQLRLPGETHSAKGVIYTQAWVAELILDLVGYRADADLATLVAVEPAAGEGAFLIPMVRRLLASLQLHERSIEEAKRALQAYELVLQP